MSQVNQSGIATTIIADSGGTRRIVRIIVAVVGGGGLIVGVVVGGGGSCRVVLIGIVGGIRIVCYCFTALVNIINIIIIIIMTWIMKLKMMMPIHEIGPPTELSFTQIFIVSMRATNQMQKLKSYIVPVGKSARAKKITLTFCKTTGNKPSLEVVTQAFGLLNVNVNLVRSCCLFTPRLMPRLEVWGPKIDILFFRPTPHDALHSQENLRFSHVAK